MPLEARGQFWDPCVTLTASTLIGTMACERRLHTCDAYTDFAKGNVSTKETSWGSVSGYRMDKQVFTMQKSVKHEPLSRKTGKEVSGMEDF
jgi:hypothetical protein